MNTKSRFKKIIARILITLTVILTLGTAWQSIPAHAFSEDEITVLFTHDIHSYLTPKDNGNGEQYGIARMKTKIDEIKNSRDTCVLVDAGDFSMGTLYQTLYQKEAVELVALGQMGFDATTLGNHEFDYRENGLTQMLTTAKTREQEEDFTLPSLLLSNLDWEKNTTEDNQKLKEAWDFYGAKKYTVIEKNGIRIGLFGIFGEDADEDAPLSGLVFEDRIESAKEAVEHLKQENADIIICLSHSGTSTNAKKSEDEILAQKVPDIDVIISGHSHTVLEQPIIYGNTYIVSCGCYTHNLGELSLKKNDEGRYELLQYSLHELNKSVAENEEIAEELLQYQDDIDRDYLQFFGYSFNQVIAHNNIEFITNGELENKGMAEEPLANLISDAYLYAVEQAEGEEGVPPDAAIAAKGMIRERIPLGDVRIKDVYDVCSLGIGPDQMAGYPLVGIWLTGEELSTLAEIDASVSGGGNAQLYPSGVSWTYNPNRLILNRVTDVSLINSDQTREPLEKDKLYRVITPLYCAQMLGSVEQQSKGILHLEARDAQGNPVTDYDTLIIRNKETGEEVKEWYALASYLQSFEPGEDGLPEVPEKYNQLQGRKTEIDSKNPIELFKNPNRIAIVLYIVILFLILVVLFIIRRVSHRMKTKRIYLH